MPHSTFTMDNFFAFMNQAMAAGIFEPSQQKEWTRFESDIPELLNEPEKEDLRRLDVSGLDERYTDTLHRKSLMASSWLIFQRKKLLTRAVGEFVAFSVNPARYWADQGTRKAAPNANNTAVKPTTAIHRQLSKPNRPPHITPEQPGKALAQAPAKTRRETGIEYQNRLLKNPTAVGKTGQMIVDPERRKEPFVSNF